MSTQLEEATKNLKLILARNRTVELSTEKALAFIQVQAQLAIAEEIKAFRELIADHCKRGGAFNR